eukprot:2747646-Prymnesium_polylepis.1
MRRAKRSEHRRSRTAMQKRKQGRADLTKKRGSLRSDHRYQYKRSTGGGYGPNGYTFWTSVPNQPP